MTDLYDRTFGELGKLNRLAGGSGSIACSLIKRLGSHPQAAIAENGPRQGFHGCLELGHVDLGHLPWHDRQIKKLETERLCCRFEQRVVGMSPTVLVVRPVANDTFKTGGFNLCQILNTDLRAGKNCGQFG